MKFARWHLWAVGLALVLLVGLLFRSDRNPEPTPQHEASHDHAPPLSPPPPPVRFDPDCATCPLKAPGAPQEFKRRPSLPAAVEECMEFMIDAAKQGIPNPDTSYLEDCRATPLFYASTVEQIQTLLDAGADPNVHGEYGQTPLSRHLHKTLIRPTEEKYAMIQALLEGGADPWMRTTDGKLPYEIARQMNMSGTLRVQGEEFLKQRLAADGITEEQAFAQKPEFAKAMEAMRRAPELANKAIASLMDAMKRTNPNPDLTRNIQ